MSDVERVKRLLEATPEVRLAVLFGSAVTGALRPDSDLDLGLSLAAGSHPSDALVAALARAAGRPIDIVLLDEAPPLVRLEIARGGLLLVERNPHQWADFRARAMIDWWDWAPTARMMHAVMAERLRQEARRGPP